MIKSPSKAAVLHLSVEEENLGSIPFAVLERRVGQRLGSIEIAGTKILPSGEEVRVSWQVQGNTELGLPTEQDLDVFVALGVLTFRNQFAKTVSFTGREIAKILGMQSVHGKFYQRLKVAMDRFIPLRFRAITETDRQEEVKWLNVFQEASFFLDRTTGRCTGTVTWTDKLIQSMNRGFFRVLDAGRYMELDGITAKHLYRFLAVAFEKSEMVMVDARVLAREHLGILRVPRYFSRLMQTLEPAFEQLIGIQVMGSYHVVSTEDWQIALTRHKSYVPERKALGGRDGATEQRLTAVRIAAALEAAGVSAERASQYTAALEDQAAAYQLERAARLLREMTEAGVVHGVAMQFAGAALDAGVETGEGREVLDWCEIAVDAWREKTANGQALRNPAGLVVRILKQRDAAGGLVTPEAARAAKKRYRQREERIAAQQHEAEQRELILEYEASRAAVAASLFAEMPEAVRSVLRHEKAALLARQGRADRMDAEARDQEVLDLVYQDIAARELPTFEKWYLRRRAGQAVLPFEADPAAISAN